jgi:hypothetical protein
MPVCRERQEAIGRGLPTYRTGKPCKHGHVAERRTDNSDCLDCIAMKKTRPLSKRTAEQTRLRNERLAQQRREMHRDDASSTVRRTLMGLGHLMAASEAQERSKYLDSLIKNGANYIRSEN